MSVDQKQRAAALNALIGKPYRLGASGPDDFDCYGIVRHLQREFWGRDLPLFEAPSDAGEIAIAGFMAAHPERRNWKPSDRAVDGAIVSMAKQDLGYHVGTWLDLDGGLIVHCIEGVGVTADKSFALRALGWRRLRYFVPV